MKTYKLIKLYPGLPSDWYVGMRVGQGDRHSYSYYSPIESRFSDFGIQANFVENNTEFWQKVKNDFKITSFIGCNNNIYTFNPITNRYYCDDFNSCTYIEMVNNLNKGFQGYPKIRSVVRVEDNSTFELGDSCTDKYDKTKIGVITEISLDGGVLTDSGHWINIEDMILLGELFETTDKVKIFHGDSFYVLGHPFNCITNKLTATSELASIYQDNKIPSFSSEESAFVYFKEKYENQKVKYSMNDILKEARIFKPHNGVINDDIMIVNIKNLKNKIL